MTGQVGRYFYSFGITSATAIMLSMFVSFTLTPALCAWWLRPQDAAAGHAQDQGPRRLRLDRPEVRAHARVVARASAADARHRRRGRRRRRSSSIPYVGKELVPDDDQSEFSVNLRLPRGTSFDRTLEYMTPIEGELRAALGTNVAAMMTSIQNGSGNYSVQLTPIEDADAVAAGADAGRAPHAEQVQERAHQRLGRHRHLGRLERGGGGRRRRRRRRRHEPAEHDRAGAGHRCSCRSTPTRCSRRSARSTA